MSLSHCFLLVTAVSRLLAGAAATPILTVSNAAPVVDLGYSQYEGTTLSSEVDQYLGMRFAAPPLGNLRFRAPQEPAATTGIQEAKTLQTVCLGNGVQLPSTLQSEDCLFANVWTPASATITSKLPVWIYIQGGGYASDSNGRYNGSTVVEQSGQNVVVVMFNYRVAAFGFLASEKIRANGDLNAGLLDQQLLFRWVKKYIQQFGGDPDHVVIHGASAGAGSVALHLLAYGGRNDDLFIGAIGESVFLPTSPKVSELEWQFDQFVSDASCAGSADELECLRSQNTTTLQAANKGRPYPGQSKSPNWYWTPTIDGDFLQDYPYKLLEQGKFVKVPIMVGDDTDEGTSFADNAASLADVATFMTRNYPRLSANDTDAINAQYPLMSPLPKHNPYFPSASAAYGESTFICPGNFICNSFATHVSPNKVWNYRYNVNSTNYDDAGLGVVHTIETQAVFGPGNVGETPAADIQSGITTVNRNIVPVVMNYWISFVRALDPNTYRFASAPRWGEFGDGRDGGRRLRFETNATEMEVVPRDQVERCEFWKDLAVVMEQ
ncbi:hypothetical protein VE01_08506 [Pseudogymnoascus verrucosus]|uniref:Carboxylic ester hydrolase n=1 Tax=Pseudogymnoascus verrucosus TaxID=342668 RepID=A0A1B8GDH0_9PEZI|nr:uncharacterized protein VE01_08506 [Pseudogymnoascus verrucosus]OBT93878.1 hypothetical protein VE01_08506 [Pseudogymnoascus verrucosus]